MRRIVHASAFALILVAASCSSESEVGEACDQPAGTTGVCEEGTVCGLPSDKARGLACIPACFGDKDCPKDFECKEAVEKAAVKGCRFKD